MFPVIQILVEDDYQTEGVLVRLHDNMMGNIVRLVGRKGPEAAAAAASYAKRSDGEEDKLFLGAQKHFAALSGPSSPHESFAEDVPPAALEASSLQSAWSECQQLYGESLTACVLEDCGGDMERALKTLRVGYALHGYVHCSGFHCLISIVLFIHSGAVRSTDVIRCRLKGHGGSDFEGGGEGW